MRIFLIAFFCSAGGLLATPTHTYNFNNDWKFHLFGNMPHGSYHPEPGAGFSPAKASSQEKNNPSLHAIDGKRSTRWCASSSAKGQWLCIDLGRTVALKGIELFWEKTHTNPYSLSLSQDGSKWVNIVQNRKNKGDKQRIPFLSKARYLLLNVDGSSGAWASIREIEIWDADNQRVFPAQPVTKDTAPGPQDANYNDTEWRSVRLPHDWAIEGPFRMDLANETGKLPWNAIGWYRKHFSLPKEAKNQRIFVDFDGAMSQAKVFVNGQFAGEWAYGYNSFRIDITHLVHRDRDNTIAVRLETLPDSTRWYPGAGIYRSVHLVTAPKTGFSHWPLAITTPSIQSNQATVSIKADLDNTETKATQATLQYRIFSPEGKEVATTSLPVTLNQASTRTSFQTELSIPHPQLWNLNTPQLYKLQAILRQGNSILDTYTTDFGIRSIEWNAQKGFLLNGKHVPLQGVCNHHDLGPLGAAVHPRAIQRQIEILKDMGCNAIRTSHNPPAPELLALCDRMGVLVIDELFDIWKLQKYGKVNGYHTFWEKWHARDVENFLRRDRNHPCIIAWSTGNEIPELRRKDMASVASHLRTLIRQYDVTRPVTLGSNEPSAPQNGFLEGVDVYGANYHLQTYGWLSKDYPNMPLYASETASTVSTRGEYFFPVLWNKSKGFFDFQVSSYDLYAPGWACKPDDEFQALDNHPRFAGEFVWTGFDYIGEPTPYNQDKTNALNFTDAKERAAAMAMLEKLGNRAPSRSSYFGILDLCGFKKDRFYLYQSRWRSDLPMAHILPHWNWPERRGKITPVHVYTSGDEAELFLNGKSLGKRKKGSPHAYRLTWDDVAYTPGTLEVIVTRQGQPWAKDRVETTGKPYALELIVDRQRIAADGNDLSYITVRVVDKQGRLVPRTHMPLAFRLKGPFDIAGIGNGDPTDHTPMKPAQTSQASIKIFNGLAQVILRSHEDIVGEGLLEVASQGLKPAKVTIVSEKH